MNNSTVTTCLSCLTIWDVKYWVNGLVCEKCNLVLCPYCSRDCDFCNKVVMCDKHVHMVDKGDICTSCLKTYIEVSYEMKGMQCLPNQLSVDKINNDFFKRNPDLKRENYQLCCQWRWGREESAPIPIEHGNLNYLCDQVKGKKKKRTVKILVFKRGKKRKLKSVEGSSTEEPPKKKIKV